MAPAPVVAVDTATVPPDGSEPDDGEQDGSEPSGEHGPGGGSPDSGGGDGSGKLGNEDLGGSEVPDSSHLKDGGGPSAADAPGGESEEADSEKTSRAEDDADVGADSQQTASPLQRRPGGRPALADLTVPLATLLDLADRPGEAHGLGPLDPDLCRDLAELAAASPHSRICITVTNPDGIAIGHGCGRPRKPVGGSPGPIRSGAPPPPGALPARLNLTITAGRLSAMLVSGASGLSATSSRAPAGWALTRRDTSGPDSPGDPDWCSTWALTPPSGPELAARIEPVPSYDCDHRHESHGYEPKDTLRHLVQIRDYTCTFPSCSRHARESDFEHARPYEKGGRTLQLQRRSTQQEMPPD